MCGDNGTMMGPRGRSASRQAGGVARRELVVGMRLGVRMTMVEVGVRWHFSTANDRRDGGRGIPP